MPDPYLSEIKYRGGAAQDFAEVVVDEGTDVSNIQVVIYNPNGTVRSTNGLGAVQSTQFDSDVYVVNAGIHKDGAVALVDNGVVISFVSFDSVLSPTVGPAAGLTSDQIGSTGTNQNQSLSTTDGTNYTAGTITEGTIPCFVSGTHIATPDGPRKVEQLRPGDLITLADGGTDTLLWHGVAEVVLSSRNAAELAPIQIPAHAFGRNSPARDLLVSPQHRVRFSSISNELHFGSTRVLIPAKHLIGWNGVCQRQDLRQASYHHLLFAQHEVILSENLATESFLPNDATTGAFAEDTQDELLRLFPDLHTLPIGPTRHLCLRRHEAALALRG